MPTILPPQIFQLAQATMSASTSNLIKMKCNSLHIWRKFVSTQKLLLLYMALYLALHSITSGQVAMVTAQGLLNCQCCGRNAAIHELFQLGAAGQPSV